MVWKGARASRDGVCGARMLPRRALGAELKAATVAIEHRP